MPKAQSYFVANAGMVPCHAEDLDNDPRGIIWMYEPPEPRGIYVMGIDPTAGLPMWNRYARTDSDYRVDNGVIQILKIGRGEEIPDRQVAEFAAPIDPEDLADVANVLGRVYGGNHEEGQAKCIIEIYPGPGLLTQRRMLQYGYGNMFVWSYLDGMTRTMTRSLGWTSSPKSTRDLWLRTSRHVIRGGVELRSPWLVEEMADAQMDRTGMRAQHIYGGHDDRWTAMQLAIWCGREWEMDVESVASDVRTDASPINYQATPITYAEMMDEWEEKFTSMMEE